MFVENCGQQILNFYILYKCRYGKMTIIWSNYRYEVYSFAFRKFLPAMVSLSLEFDLFGLFEHGSSGSGLDLESHAPGRAGYDPLRGLDVRSVEVGHLGLRDLLHLLVGDRTHLVAIRLSRAFRDASSLLQQVDCGRALRVQLKRPIVEYSNIC